MSHSHPTGFDDKVRFLSELGRRLHLYGVSVQRLEGALIRVARTLHVSCEVWSTPTGLLLSIADSADEQGAQTTRVLRLAPGDIDLSAMCTVDEIAEDVMAGRLDVAGGLAALHALDRTPSRRRMIAIVLAFGLASGSVAGLLRTGWVDIVVATLLGFVIGTIAIASATRPNLAAASEALSAIVATILAAAVATFIVPLSMQTVIIASLIVLMPGLTLTTAVSELAEQHLSSGTARFAGAMTTLLKLAFGSIAATQLVAMFGWTPRQASASSLPAGVELAALVGAAFSFAVLFRARRKDVLLVMAAASLGYLLTRTGSAIGGLSEGAFAGAVFFSALVVGALSNAYGRVVRRPGSLVRVPGIMLLVPGSVGFRSLSSVMAGNYTLGLETGVAVLSALIALVAGLLFGSLVVPPRRFL